MKMRLGGSFSLKRQGSGQVQDCRQQKQAGALDC
jgi:hypothetical protein